MGGIFNTVNSHLYHYAGNNPVKYTDPDGESPVIPILIIAGIALSLSSDSHSRRSQIMSVGESLNIDMKLNNTSYADGGPRLPAFSRPAGRESYGNITLDSNQLGRAASSIPRGGLDPNDYDDGRESPRGTIVGAIGLGGSMLANYLSESESGGHYADVKLNYTKADGKLLEWNIRITGIDPNGVSPKDRILSKNEALMYLHENRARLIENGTYNQIGNLFN
jgi:hypothetical protein